MFDKTLGLQNPVIGRGAARMEMCGNFWAWNGIVSGLNNWYFIYVLAPSSVYRLPISRQHLLTGPWEWFCPLYHDQWHSLVGYTLRKVFFSFFMLWLTLNLFSLFHPNLEFFSFTWLRGRKPASLQQYSLVAPFWLWFWDNLCRCHDWRHSSTWGSNFKSFLSSCSCHQSLSEGDVARARISSWCLTQHDV